jgi:hypothetical protein
MNEAKPTSYGFVRIITKVTIIAYSKDQESRTMQIRVRLDFLNAL